MRFFDEIDQAIRKLANDDPSKWILHVSSDVWRELRGSVTRSGSCDTTRDDGGTLWHVPVKVHPDTVMFWTLMGAKEKFVPPAPVKALNTLASAVDRILVSDWSWNISSIRRVTESAPGSLDLPRVAMQVEQSSTGVMYYWVVLNPDKAAPNLGGASATREQAQTAAELAGRRWYRWERDSDGKDF